MGEHLTGSVGIVHPNSPWRQGSPPPGNSQDNQQVVIGLLSRIPSDQGGMHDEWSTPPLPGADGMCPQFLGDAIYGFQSFWKANGTFKNIDGVVDPGGNTLRVMNSLVLGEQAKASGPNGLLPANAPNLTKITNTLRSLFPNPSPWTLLNAPGVAAGFVVSGSIGQLDLQHNDGTTRYMTYGAFGAGLGIDTGGTPVTFTASTRDDMWSATSIKALSGMGRIFSRTPQPLTFDDMCGQMIVVGVTGACSDKFYSSVYQTATGQQMLRGLSFTVFLLGVPADRIGPGLINPNLVSRLPEMAMSARAIAMSAGECVGIDLSIGITFGIAVPDKKREVFNQLKQTDVADPYIKKVDDTLTRAANNAYDAAYQKLKDWSPF